MRGTIDHVWEDETKGGQRYLTVQMNGERYSVWELKVRGPLSGLPCCPLGLWFTIAGQCLVGAVP
jgi:hypothetical protein